MASLMIIACSFCCALTWAAGGSVQVQDPALQDARREMGRLHQQLREGFTLRADGEVVTLRRLRVRAGEGPIDPRRGASNSLEVFDYPERDRPKTTLSLVIVRDGERQYMEVAPRSSDPRQHAEHYSIPAEYLIHADKVSLALDHRNKVLVQADANSFPAAEPDTLPAPHAPVMVALASRAEDWISLMTGSRPESLKLQLRDQKVEDAGDRLRVVEAYTNDDRVTYERVVEYSKVNYLPVLLQLSRAGRQTGGRWAFEWQPSQSLNEHELVVSGHRLAGVSAETVFYVDPQKPGYPNRLVTYEIAEFRPGGPSPDDPVVQSGKLAHLDLPDGYTYDDHRTSTIQAREAAHDHEQQSMAPTSAVLIAALVTAAILLCYRFVIPMFRRQRPASR